MHPPDYASLIREMRAARRWLAFLIYGEKLFFFTKAVRHKRHSPVFKGYLPQVFNHIRGSVKPAKLRRYAVF